MLISDRWSVTEIRELSARSSITKERRGREDEEGEEGAHFAVLGLPARSAQPPHGLRLDLRSSELRAGGVPGAPPLPPVVPPVVPPVAPPAASHCTGPEPVALFRPRFRGWVAPSP
jgi:hypothetical protein